MKHDLSIDDGDLEYIAARLAEVRGTVDRLREAVERLLGMRVRGRVLLFGKEILTWEATVSSGPAGPEPAPASAPPPAAGG